MPKKQDLQLEPDGTLRIELIGPDDTGLDPAWHALPDQEKWDRVRAFMEAGVEFERRFAGRDVSLKMARDRCVFEGLPPPEPRAAPAGAGMGEDLPGPSGPAGVG